MSKWKGLWKCEKCSEVLTKKLRMHYRYDAHGVARECNGKIHPHDRRTSPDEQDEKTGLPLIPRSTHDVKLYRASPDLDLIRELRDAFVAGVREGLPAAITSKGWDRLKNQAKSEALRRYPDSYLKQAEKEKGT